MKKIFLAAFALILFTATGQVNIGAYGGIEPSGNYPALKDAFILGGVKAADDTANVPDYLLENGTLVFQYSDTTTYRKITGGWEEFAFGGTAGGSSGGDDWGTQSVVSNTTLNGTGVVGDALGLNWFANENGSFIFGDSSAYNIGSTFGQNVFFGPRVGYNFIGSYSTGVGYNALRNSIGSPASDPWGTSIDSSAFGNAFGWGALSNIDHVTYTTGIGTLAGAYNQRTYRTLFFGEFAGYNNPNDATAIAINDGDIVTKPRVIKRSLLMGDYTGAFLNRDVQDSYIQGYEGLLYGGGVDNIGIGSYVFYRGHNQGGFQGDYNIYIGNRLNRSDTNRAVPPSLNNFDSTIVIGHDINPPALSKHQIYFPEGWEIKGAVIDTSQIKNYTAGAGGATPNLQQVIDQSLNTTASIPEGDGVEIITDQGGGGNNRTSLNIYNGTILMEGDDDRNTLNTQRSTISIGGNSWGMSYSSAGAPRANMVGNSTGIDIRSIRTEIQDEGAVPIADFDTPGLNIADGRDLLFNNQMRFTSIGDSVLKLQRLDGGLWIDAILGSDPIDLDDVLANGNIAIDKSLVISTGPLGTTTGTGSLALSYGSTNATGNYAIAFGRNVDANGNYSMCGGIDSDVNGEDAVAFGVNNSVNSKGAGTIGVFNNVDGTGAVGLGYGLHTNNAGEVGVGFANVHLTPNPVDSLKRIFSIGAGMDFINETPGDERDALRVLKNATGFIDNVWSYNGDYSARYTPRSLVDKAYVDAVAGGALPTFQEIFDASGGFINGGNTGNIGISQMSEVEIGTENRLFLFTQGAGNDNASITIEEAADPTIYFNVFKDGVSSNSFTMLHGQTTSNQEINYTADFSSNYTARSLVDKAYVDQAIAGAGGGADDWGTQVVQSDATLLGDGTAGNVLRVDTNQIATQHDLGQVSAAGSSVSAGYGINVNQTGSDFNVETDTNEIATQFDLANGLAVKSDDGHGHNATEIALTPSGNISSTTVDQGILEAYNDAVAYSDANDDIGLTEVTTTGTTLNGTGTGDQPLEVDTTEIATVYNLGLTQQDLDQTTLALYDSINGLRNDLQAAEARIDQLEQVDTAEVTISRNATAADFSYKGAVRYAESATVTFTIPTGLVVPKFSYMVATRIAPGVTYRMDFSNVVLYDSEMTSIGSPSNVSMNEATITAIGPDTYKIAGKYTVN